jgi:glutamine synthetase
MTINLAEVAKERGIKYFLISYTDLFASQRAKLVPASAIAGMQKNGAGFAGFATWLDMSPADPDMFALPDPDTAALEAGSGLACIRYLDGGQAGGTGAAGGTEKGDRRRRRSWV